MTKAAGSGVFLVDVCGTLFFDDTTIGLLKHHFRKHGKIRLKYAMLAAMTYRLSPLCLGLKLGEKLSGRHLLKHLAVRLLKGHSLCSLRESADEYASFLLVHRKIPAVWERLDKPLSSGKVVLASASLDPIVASLARQLNAKYVASSLEHLDGCLTGKYSCDLTSRKDKALADKLGLNAESDIESIFTDNLSDIEIVRKSKNSYIVIHKLSHRSRWQVVCAEFIEVSR